MSRLIEIETLVDLPGELEIAVGDLLAFPATGGRVTSGAGVIAMLGAFVPGTLTAGGRVVAPVGAPGTVVVLARGPGRARLELMAGDPWRAPTTTVVSLRVDP